MTARTPEQDGPRLVAGTEPPAGDGLSGPRGSRQIRRRLAFRAADALGESSGPRDGRPGPRGKKRKSGPSPWQRAEEAWRNADLPWNGTGEAAPASSRPDGTTATGSVKTSTRDEKSAAGKAASGEKTASGGTSTASGKPAPGKKPATRPAAEEKSARGEEAASGGGSAPGGKAASSAKAESGETEKADRTEGGKPGASGKNGGKRQRRAAARAARTAGVVSAAAATTAADTADETTGAAEEPTGTAESSEPATTSEPAKSSEPAQSSEPAEASEAAGTPESTETSGGAKQEEEPKAAAVAPPRRLGLRRPPHAAVAIGVGAVVIAGAAAFAVTGGGDDAGPRSAVAAATVAEEWFGADPAAKTDGLVQDVAAVAAHGATVVAVGTETAGDGTPGRERAEFLLSQDSGKTWRLAEVRTPDGEVPAPGARPRMVAGGAGAWVAIGQAADGRVAVWTSVDGRSWTQESAGTAAFGPGDRVNALVRTASGFVAAGAASPAGAPAAGGRAVVWTSADGRGWQRADRLDLPEIAAIGGLAASGDTVVAHGTFSRTTTRTVKRKGKKKGTRQVTETVRGEGMWRSADGGRTWTAVTIPQGQGAYGPVTALTAAPNGFALVREGRSETGPKKKRRTGRHGVVFGSADGAAWAPAARLTVPGYRNVERLSGTRSGLAALVRGQNNTGTVLRSSDGRTWRPAGGIGAPGPGSAISGLAAADGGAVLTGHRGEDGFLALATAPGPVTTLDLAGVPGVVRPERTLAACAVDRSGRLVVVGSTGGDAAVWTSADGAAWTRGRGVAAGAGRVGGPGQPRHRLTDVAGGPQGWVAVGQADAPRGGSAPVVAVSQDGLTWRRAGLPGGRTASGVVSGRGGYVVVGMAGGSAAAWRSTDLRSWKRGGNAGRGDLDGPTWMRDVAATSGGYVAVGGRRGTAPSGQRGGAGRAPADLPAIWRSADGLTWAAVPSPALPAGIVSGAFFQVVSRGDALVALGWGRTAPAPGAAQGRPAAFVAHSADGGRTWRAGVPQGAGETTSLTAATATPNGFLLAGVTGAPGRQDVVLWTSPGGAGDWRRLAAAGRGLTGHGDQRLTALAVRGGEVVGTGVSADHRGETPTFWRTPAP